VDSINDIDKVPASTNSKQYIKKNFHNKYKLNKENKYVCQNFHEPTPYILELAQSYLLIHGARDGMSGNLDYSALFSSMEIHNLEGNEKIIVLEAVRDVEHIIKKLNESKSDKK
jgi:hypothetical protein